MSITTAPPIISRLVEVAESRSGDLKIVVDTAIRNQPNYAHHQTIHIARIDVAQFMEKLGIAVSGTLTQAINQPQAEDCPFCYIEVWTCQECEDKDDDLAIEEQKVCERDAHIDILEALLKEHKINFEPFDG